MTRVLMIAPTPFFSDRGCHVRVFEEAAELGRRGAEVKVVTYPLGQDPPGVSVARAVRVSPYRRAEAGPSWLRLPLDAAVLATSVRLARQFRPRLIHAHLHEGAMIGAALKQFFRVPLVFDYQGSLLGESLQHRFVRPGGATAKALAGVERRLDASADLVVTSSATMAEGLRQRGLRVEVLPDCVDPDRFRPGSPDPELARALGLDPGSPVAVFLGVMSDYQGVDLLLDALERLGDHGVQFLLMGYPEEKYRREAERRGLGRSARFTGRVGYFEADRYLRLGQVGLAPKLAVTEANGKVLAYMATGLPVVAFDLPVNRELLGDAAEWVPTSGDRREQARNFAAVTAGLLADPDRRARLGAAGRERAERMFSVRAQGDRLERIYRGLVG